ncbi:sulfite exporter TauE/SafE family protein [Thalassomonas haliotis]|uniref:Probable membrane transporter protein n=1 Tax=Thalassomonas haliotis TaxID=485448 RepID=A0ABY7VE41_9GAMM|nr:sulfite exporter TauE/SafE family protein [Thalassomonas haliotis]WDE11989.1 sulfite exporter TauE/SafE family protein [Thalassomonas haliotis]
MDYLIQSLKANTRIFSVLNRAHLFFALSIVLFWLTSYGFDWALENLMRHYSIAITMIFGSLVAGGTALGGGSVAFPVLTKTLGIVPIKAKIFSLAIQSVGMTAASATIICKKIPFYPRMVGLTLIGAVPGVLVSLTWISDLIPRLATKSIFSLLLLAFAIVLIKTYSPQSKESSSYHHARILVPCFGFFGGIISGLLGSGVDIFIFSLLVLYYRVDIKKATATSVIVMAIISIISSMYNIFVLETLTPEIQQYVHAAMPVVVFGAPLGAWICSRLPNTVLLMILLFLISCEVGFTGYELLGRLFVWG